MEFFSRYQKILVGLGFIGIVLVLGYALYALFFMAPAIEPAKPGQTPTTTGNILPGSKDGAGTTGSSTASGRLTGGSQPGDARPVSNLNQVREISQSPSLGMTAGTGGSGLQYYNKQDGKFYRVDSSGNITALTDKVFHSVEKIAWAPNKNKAILSYPDGANIVYDFSSNKQITLPSHWKDFDFSPDSGRIVMKSIGLDPENRWLAITNEDGSQARKIEAIGEKDSTVYPSWSPNNQTIAMYTEGIDFNRQEVFFVGLNNENFKSLIVEGRGFEPKWAPKGDRLLYSVYSTDSDLKPELWITNAQGESIGTGRKKLDIETWANKCSFADTSTLYCAVPDNLQQGAGLFPELARNTTDKLYAIDVRTGTKKIVSTPEGNFNISDIVVSDSGKDLFFTDALSEKVYKIDLK